MSTKTPEHRLEFLLAFDGRRHWYGGGYHIRFEIKRIIATPIRPHGLRYSFTLHGPDNKRLIGFDNAHPVSLKGSRFNPKAVAADHWHRDETDDGRPYDFIDAEHLIEDFFNEVERVLIAHGIPVETVSVEEERKKE